MQLSSLWLFFVLIMLVIFGKNVDGMAGGKARYCSKNLSNALSLVCMGRGYNEPSMNNGSNGESGGVVRECCLDSSGCSYYDLEKYCKPLNDSTRGINQQSSM